MYPRHVRLVYGASGTIDEMVRLAGHMSSRVRLGNGVMPEFEHEKMEAMGLEFGIGDMAGCK